MTLFKQLFLGTSIAFLAVLGAMEGVYIKNAHKYLQEQLVSHSQDAATSLGLVLPTAMADGDLIRAEVTVNAMFDRGYYQSICLVDVRGETLLLKSLSPRPAEVPQWFVTLLPMEIPVAESLISKGWRQMGRVVVASHPNFAYKQLWRTLLEATLGLILLYVLALLALHSFLTRILRPLHDIETVAHAISERDFQLVKSQPGTRELMSVVNAINSMSTKLRSVIDHEVLQANRFRDESNKDALTGLENRRGFEQQMSALSDDDLGSGVMYMLQVGNFQKFNSTHGFRDGDALLKALSQVMLSIRTENNALRARINGGTFLMVAFNLSREEAVRLGDELCRSFGGVIAALSGKVQLPLGCGGAYFSGKKVTLNALLAQCDFAMLKSQASPHPLNIMLDLAEDDDNEKKGGSQFWKRLILDALQDDRLVLLSQSVMGLKDSKRMQIEVVGRLKNSEGEMIPAEKFIPMANRHHLTPALDLAVLRKLADAATGNLEVAVNLSINSINDKSLNDWVIATLRDNPSLANRLIFEFTEFGVVQDPDSVAKFVANIRKLGAKFAVDNFGLHQSAFEYLQKLKPTYVKLSPTYIHKLRTDHENQFFISSVVKITQSLEIKVIALGVEDAGILELLQKLGVDGYQGYVTGALTQME